MILSFLILLAIAFVTDIAFVIHYSVITPWWTGPIGKTLVAKSLCLASLYGWTLVVWIWPHVPFRTEIRLGLFIVLTAVTVWRYFVLIKVAKDTKEFKTELDELHALMKQADKEE